MLRRRIEAKRMGEQRPVEKPVAGKQRIVAGLGIILDTTGSEQFMLEIERRVSFKARFAKETKDRQEKLSEMRGEVATAKRKAIAAKEPWQMLREDAVWGEWIPDGLSTDRALKARLARWEKIQKEAAATGETIESVEKAIAQEKARIARANDHRAAVQKAISEGKPVPAEVLADYPDLKKQTSETAPDTSATARKGNGSKLPIQGEPQRAGARVKAQDFSFAKSEHPVITKTADMIEASGATRIMADAVLDAYGETSKAMGQSIKTSTPQLDVLQELRRRGWTVRPEKDITPTNFTAYRPTDGSRSKATAADLSVAVPEGVSPEAVEEGAKVEKEHGTTYNQIKDYYAENGEFPPFDMVTEWIASDHLKEFADYYEALEAMEKELKAEKKPRAEAMRRTKAAGPFDLSKYKNDKGEYEAYAWPGGYPVYYLAADGEVICPECMNKEKKLIEEATANPGTDKQWEIVGTDANWEDTEMYCANCNKHMESAYGEDDGGDKVDAMKAKAYDTGSATIGMWMLKDIAQNYKTGRIKEKEIRGRVVWLANKSGEKLSEQEIDKIVNEIKESKKTAMSAKAEYSKATVERVAEELGKAQGISINDVQNVADYLKIGYTAEEIAEEYNDWPVDDIVQVIEKLEMYKDENSEVPEDNEGEPQDEDFIISDSRGSTYDVGIKNGRHIGTAKDWDAAEQMIRDFTKNDNWAYFPTVWHINDHGNASIVTDFNYDK
jgi:hypothetical protein